MKKHLFWLCVIIGLLCTSALRISYSSCQIEAKKETLDLVILHINDTHGHLYPFNYKGRGDVGGIARLSTLIKTIREENKECTLVFHAGDIFSRGGPLTVYYAGKVNMLAMDKIGYDAFIPGNGEFYTLVDNLIEQTSRVRFPTVLANVFYKNSGERLYPPYTILEVAGIKVGILGLGFIRENHPSAWTLEYQDPVEAAREFVPFLKETTDLVIALSHVELRYFSRLAAEVPNIDIIVGGHTHNFIRSPKLLPRKKGDGGVIMVMAGEFTTCLGRLDVQLKLDDHDRYVISKYEGRLIPIDSSIEEDSEIVELLEKYSEPLHEVIASSMISLPLSDEQISIGNFVVKAMYKHIGGDLALLFRPSIHAAIQPGDITLAHICRVHKWRSRIVEFSLIGSEIQELQQEKTVFWAGPSSLDPAKEYKVIADEALLMNTNSLQNIPFKETGERVDTILLKHLKQIKVIE
jgi:5'-nucleotidase